MTRDTWVCETCGLRFLLELDRLTLCLTHGEHEHCHLGDRIICADGSVQTAVASPHCIPWVPT